MKATKPVTLLLCAVVALEMNAQPSARMISLFDGWNGRIWEGVSPSAYELNGMEVTLATSRQVTMHDASAIDGLANLVVGGEHFPGSVVRIGDDVNGGLGAKVEVVIEGVGGERPGIWWVMDGRGPDPGHFKADPSWRIEVREQGEREVRCGGYDAISVSHMEGWGPDAAGGAVPKRVLGGWIGGGNVEYRGVISRLVDLTPYRGKNVVITAQSVDCSHRGHRGFMLFGLAYTPNLGITHTGEWCTDSVITLTAPDGGNSYRWSNGRTERSISVTKGGAYSVEVGFLGASCPLKLTDTVPEQPEPNVEPFTLSDTVICVGKALCVNARLVESDSTITVRWDYGTGVLVDSTRHRIKYMSPGWETIARVITVGSCEYRQEKVLLVVGHSPATEVFVLCGRSRSFGARISGIGPTAKSARLTVTSSGGVAIAVEQDAPIPDSAFFQLQADSTYEFLLIVVDSLGCDTSWSVTEVIPRNPQASGESYRLGAGTARDFVFDGTTSTDATMIEVLVLSRDGNGELLWEQSAKKALHFHKDEFVHYRVRAEGPRLTCPSEIELVRDVCGPIMDLSWVEMRAQIDPPQQPFGPDEHPIR